MKILIVDDEAVNRTILRYMLEQQGYQECIEAASGQEALALAKAHSPDLVLLDVVMPGMSGYEVATILKRESGELYLPIIFITSLEDKDSLVRCLEAGGDDFATKPFDNILLSAKIRSHARIRMLSTRIDRQNQSLRYYQQSVEREHAIVDHIFQNAIVNPHDVVRFFDCHVSPATQFNGDVFLCAKSPKGGIYFFVGDFTGHGLASAVGALPITRMFQQLTKRGVSVSEIASSANALLESMLPPDMFCAAVIAEVSTDGRRLSVWSGGMPQVLVKNRETGMVRTYPSNHMALGILTADEFDAQCENFSVNEGDQVIVYTDGITDVSPPEGEMLDEAGFENWVSDSNVVSAGELYQRALDYSENTAPNDDITLVIYNSQPLELHVTPETEDTLPFSLSVKLDAMYLREYNPLEPILSMLSSQPVLNAVRADLFTVISEMFNNALEHGVLKLESVVKSDPEGFLRYYDMREEALSKLESGWITITIDFNPNDYSVVVNVEDSGDGFNPRDISMSDDESYGRGLSLLNQLASEIWYEKGGRSVFVKLIFASIDP